MTKTVVATLAGAVIVIVLLVLAATGAFAQADNRDLLRTVCMDDYKKFCAGVQPGGGRILKCLRDRAKDLAPACRDGLATAAR